MSKKIENRVCIIGAGVAGCATAAALKDYNIDFVVYDANDKAGGVWANNYPGAKVQATFELYEFPDKKFPKGMRDRKDPPAPTAEEVCAYLDEFLVERNIKQDFCFNARVKDMHQLKDDQWHIKFSDGSTKTFPYVIVCTGLVSAKPNMIDIPGIEDFIKGGGSVFHSSQRKDESLCKDKRVIVIGNGKSAVDAASDAAKIAKQHGTKSPLQIARRATWYVPRYVLGFLQYKWVFHTRIGSALLPRYYEVKNPILIVLHMLFTPLKWFLWRVVELLLLLQYRLPFRLQPRVGTVLRGALETSVLITDESHLRKLRNREIDMRIATVKKLEPGKAILSNGDVEGVDTIVMATGWQLAFDTFLDPNTTLKDLEAEDDGIWLYRNILPAKVKGIAFVGSNTLTFMNIFTSYIQAYWLASLLADQREWPSTEHMQETIARDKAFRRKHYPQNCLRGASIELYMQHYHDVLFQEMGARRPFHCLIRPFADMVVPVIPSLMANKIRPNEEEQDAFLKREKSFLPSNREQTKEGVATTEALGDELF